MGTLPLRLIHSIHAMLLLYSTQSQHSPSHYFHNSPYSPSPFSSLSSCFPFPVSWVFTFRVNVTAYFFDTGDRSLTLLGETVFGLLPQEIKRDQCLKLRPGGSGLALFARVAFRCISSVRFEIAAKLPVAHPLYTTLLRQGSRPLRHQNYLTWLCGDRVWMERDLAVTELVGHLLLGIFEEFAFGIA